MAMYDVTSFGATGRARRRETLRLESLRWNYLAYPDDTAADIYDLGPGEHEYDSVGVQRAIDAAHEAGGGEVVVPAGDYLIAPILLKSHVALRLENGARLWGAPRIDDYRAGGGGDSIGSSVDSAYNRKRMRMNRRERRLVTADEAEDVAIVGAGQISGQSPAFIFPWMNEGPPTKRPDVRPHDTLFFHRCRDVRIEGIRILDAPAWTMVFDECDGVRIHGVTIRNFDVVNADGIDLVATSNVTISDCRLWVMDDAICLKNVSPDVTMRNIAVTNCLIRTLCNGLKIGTDTTGNFENIAFDNIVVHNPEDDIKGAEGGINLCAIDGGLVRGVNASNIVMRNVHTPFYLVAGRRGRVQSQFREPRPGALEDVSITNVRVDGARRTSFVVGHRDSPIRRVHLGNIHVRKTGEFCAERPSAPVPAIEEQYPSGHMFGSRERGDQLPAYGLYLRDVEDLTGHDLRFECAGDDARATVRAERCARVLFHDVATNLRGGVPEMRIDEEDGRIGTE